MKLYNFEKIGYTFKRSKEVDMNSIKPEKKNKFLNVGLTPSMDDKIQAFADKHEVNRSEAARYILELFFQSDSENIEAHPISKNDSDFGNFGIAS
jgi:DNA polymerase III delta subunit